MGSESPPFRPPQTLGQAGQDTQDAALQLVKSARDALPTAILGSFVSAAYFEAAEVAILGALSLLAGMAGVWRVYERTRRWDGPLVARAVQVWLGRMIGDRLILGVVLAVAFVAIVIQTVVSDPARLLAAAIAYIAVSYTLSSAIALVGVHQRMVRIGDEPIDDEYARDPLILAKFVQAKGEIMKAGGDDVVARSVLEPEADQRARLEGWINAAASDAESQFVTAESGRLVALLHDVGGRVVFVALPPRLSVRGWVAILGVLTMVALTKYPVVALLADDANAEVRHLLERVWGWVESGETRVRMPAAWSAAGGDSVEPVQASQTATA